MASYDILMISVLAGATLWGAFKGAAWQLASLAALVASYFASYHLSDELTNSGLFGETAPWNRFAAMLSIYIVTSIIIWMAFRVVSDTIQKIKLKDFDRQLGALFGLFKGIIFCLLITFFVVTLVPTRRDEVISTRSGHYVAVLLSKADTLVPPEFQEVLDPYIKRFEENLQPSNSADSPNAAGVNPGSPNSPQTNLGNAGNQPNPSGPATNPGNANLPNIPSDVLNNLGDVLNNLGNVPRSSNNGLNNPSDVLNSLNDALNNPNNAPSKAP